jgi:hypothetical protein
VTAKHRNNVLLDRPRRQMGPVPCMVCGILAAMVDDPDATFSKETERLFIPAVPLLGKACMRWDFQLVGRIPPCEFERIPQNIDCMGDLSDTRRDSPYAKRPPTTREDQRRATNHRDPVRMDAAANRLVRHTVLFRDGPERFASIVVRSNLRPAVRWDRGPRHGRSRDQDWYPAGNSRSDAVGLP